MTIFEKGRPFKQVTAGNGLRLPIAKSKFTVNKQGQLIVKEEISIMEGPQLKLYDKHTGQM